MLVSDLEKVARCISSLYKSSEEIHLATFSRSVDLEIQSEEDGYSRSVFFYANPGMSRRFA